MLLTIFRHGESPEAADDRSRDLSERGRNEVARGAALLSTACPARELPLPDSILHSPWLRTTHTASIVARELDIAGIDSQALLKPGASVDAILDWLPTLDGLRHAILVGHQPMVSRLVDRLLGEPGRVPSLSPGGLATLALDTPAPGGARLLFWAVPPHYEANE